MIRSDQVLKTVEMIQRENLDVRTVTLGVNLLDCRRTSVKETCEAITFKITRIAGDFVELCEKAAERYGVQVVNKRVSVTPISHVGAGFDKKGFVSLAKALDDAAAKIGVDLVGGFSANIEKGMSDADKVFIDSIPEALFSTKKVCGSVNAASTRAGINMDGVTLLGETIKGLAERSSDNDGFAAAKFVVFANQPGDNPFMAGAIHSLGEPEAVLNVGVSGPGVVARALERKIAHEGAENISLDDLAEEIKQAAFRVTRCGELIGRKLSEELRIPFGVVDLSLAPTPKVGDSVGEILRILGVDEIGAPGSTAILAMLNDAVKKGGSFASRNVGGLSGAFIPVMEDAELAKAVENGSLTLEKLEAMTSVCSVGAGHDRHPGGGRRRHDLGHHRRRAGHRRHQQQDDRRPTHPRPPDARLASLSHSAACSERVSSCPCATWASPPGSWRSAGTSPPPSTA